MSEEELLQKKVGILGKQFPPGMAGQGHSLRPR